jgi:hypothetical protein
MELTGTLYLAPLLYVVSPRIVDYPLYRIRRLLTMAAERLDDSTEATLVGGLRAGDRYGQVAAVDARRQSGDNGDHEVVEWRLSSAGVAQRSEEAGRSTTAARW